MNRALAQTSPGSNGLLFLPVHTAHGGFVGLRLDHSRANMSRAILEGTAFELRGALEDMRRANLPVEQLWMAGGSTRSPVWTRILADVTGAPLTRPKPLPGRGHPERWGAGAFESVEAGQAACKARPPLAPDGASGLFMMSLRRTSR
jgi:xylulokinase